MRPGRVVMGLLFFPRGGSAYVVRYLSPALARVGWSVSLAVGSLGVAGHETYAPTFFDGLDVHFLDYTDAVCAFEAGGDAIAAPVPMHPSYEDRVGVADVLLASVPPDRAEHLSAAWDAPLLAAGADHADVFHLHHLTPQLDAAHRRWPDVPLVVHLHGTELTLLRAIEERVALAATLGETLVTLADAAPDVAESASGLDGPQVEMLRTTRWSSWRHGEFWAARLKQQARLADHLITVSPQNRDAAISMLGIEPEHVTAIPNGVDIERFRPRPRTPGTRRAAFRRALVEDPQGWKESGPPGTLAYTEADLDRLLGGDDDASVLLYVGRFLGVKRVPALVRAFARARNRFTRAGSLVIWGGHPGEWEGEHPVTVAEEVGTDGIYFAGWRGHHDLPEGLAMCDALGHPFDRGRVPSGTPRGDGGRPPRRRVPQRWPRVDSQPRPRASNWMARASGRPRRPHRCAHVSREQPRGDCRTGRQRTGARSRRVVMGRPRQPLRGNLRPRQRTPPHTAACGGDRSAHFRWFAHHALRAFIFRSE